MPKSIRPKNMVFTLHDPDLKGFLPEQILDRCSSVKNLRFIVFQWEVTPSQTESKTHLQGYLEFGDNKSFKVANRELFGNQAWLSRRLGTQAEAIAYCTDKTKRLVRQDSFRWGTPKVAYDAWNKQQKDIPLNREEQWIYIERKIIAGEYSSLDEIHHDFPYLVIHHPAKLHALLNLHNPIEFSRLVPAKTIWIYGPSRSGKSCLNSQLLFQQLGYQDHDVTYLKSDLETKLYFDYSDDQKKVLVCEEVRKEWPKYNSLINWIDRKSLLPVKGGLIRNNFELIIINSLLKPEAIYADLPLENRIEPLGRIYSGQVLQVLRNQVSHREISLQLSRGEIAAADFPYRYQPLVTDVTKAYPVEVRTFFEQ